MRCSICKAHRTRLHTCVVCGTKLCGCCSYNNQHRPRWRFCCYPDGPKCGNVVRERIKAEGATAINENAREYERARASLAALMGDTKDAARWRQRMAEPMPLWEGMQDDADQARLFQ